MLHDVVSFPLVLLMTCVVFVLYLMFRTPDNNNNIIHNEYNNNISKSDKQHTKYHTPAQPTTPHTSNMNGINIINNNNNINHNINNIDNIDNRQHKGQH